ncbi:MAG TPA: DUF2892 domain-containing protein [Phaeodactylibacter sp.]|nr:DUF2892 domain-containing protein [Phaeodactylibacter sp.]
MKKNVGNVDKYIRLIVALIIAVVLFMGKVVISSTLGIILAIVAVVFAVTALAGSCPLYSIVGISTCPVKDK